MDKYKAEEYRIQNCFLLRQLLTTLITILTGGLVGLIFAERNLVTGLIFAAGLFFLFVFGASLRRIIELNGYLYKKQRKS